MLHNGPGVTVLATFDDLTAAEIACSLLSEGSLRPDEPEVVGLGRWLVQVRDLTPDLADRARVVLKCAHACEARTVGKQAEVSTA